PRVASKNGQSNIRSISNRMSPAISGGKANRIIPPTISRYQANIGIRLMRMPGARHFMMPTMISTAAAIEATSMKERPSSQMSAPMPENSLLVASGGYMNQPVLGAELKKIDPQTKIPPSRKLQKPKAERRGKGSSRAPSIDGSRKIAMASKIGTAK